MSSKAIVVKAHNQDDFETFLENFMDEGFKPISAGYTPDGVNQIRTGVIPRGTYQRSFWWAIMVKEV